MEQRSLFVTVRHWKLWPFSLPPGTGGQLVLAAVLRVALNTAPPFLGGEDEMHSGTLINDLFAVVERIQMFAKRGHCAAGSSHQESSESEQFPQPFGLSPADRNLGLLLVVHAQLVGTLEPGNDFADAVDVHQVGAVRPPEKIRV